MVSAFFLNCCISVCVILAKREKLILALHMCSSDFTHSRMVVYNGAAVHSINRVLLAIYRIYHDK